MAFPAGHWFVAVGQASCGFSCVSQGAPASWQTLHYGDTGTRANRNQFSMVFPSIPDPAGNEYDLSALSMARQPWTAVDTSVDGKKRIFYLSVCSPLPYIPRCHGVLVPSPCCVRDLTESRAAPLTRYSFVLRHCSGVLPGVRRPRSELGCGADQSPG